MVLDKPPVVRAETIEYLWNVYNTINEWIKFSDVKAAAILAANGSIATVALASAELINNQLSANQLSYFPLIAGAIFLVLSTTCAVKCVLPTLNVGEPTSLIYFAHIAKGFKTAAKYESEIQDKLFLSPNQISQLTHQIWANSMVCWRKYSCVVWSTRFFVITICIVIAGIVHAAFF